MRAIFIYGWYGTPEGYPDYREHSGQEVEVLTSLHPSECDYDEVGMMYRIRAADGWQGDVFMEELLHVN